MQYKIVKYAYFNIIITIYKYIRHLYFNKNRFFKKNLALFKYIITNNSGVLKYFLN